MKLNIDAVHPKSDPCKRPFFSQSLADDFKLLIWQPHNPQHRVDSLPSAIFPKLFETDYSFFGMELLCGYESVQCVFSGVN